MADIVPKVSDGNTVWLTRNSDCAFALRRRDMDGNPVDWDSEVWLFVDIDKKNPTKIVTTVEGSLARIRIESEVADTIRHGTAWRAIRSVDGVPFSLEKPLMVGGFGRNDGGL